MTKCPKCDFYMEDGYVHAGKGAFFSKDKHRLTVFTSEAAGDVRLIRIGKGRRPAQFCRHCNLVIFTGE